METRDRHRLEWHTRGIEELGLRCNAREHRTLGCGSFAVGDRGYLPLVIIEAEEKRMSPKEADRT